MKCRIIILNLLRKSWKTSTNKQGFELVTIIDSIVTGIIFASDCCMDHQINDYVNKLSESRKDIFIYLHELIIHAFPEIEIDLYYKMPTYHLNKNWIAIGNQKHHISFYTCSEEHLKVFKSRFPAFNHKK